MKYARSSLLGFALFAGLAAACGARTPLDIDGEYERGNTAGQGGASAGQGGGSSISGHPAIGGQGNGGNAPYKADCTSAGVQYIYILGVSGTLYAFDPAGGSITPLHNLDCPTEDGDTPFSMAVDRQGHAYVVYSSQALFRVSLATGACTSIPSYVPEQHGFGTYGMGFSTDVNGPTETLFLAQSCDESGNDPCPVSPALATLDTTSFKLNPIAAFPDMEGGLELTGTGDGRLYGFFGVDTATEHPSSIIVRVDKKTAAFSEEIPLPDVPLGNGWAFGFWGGDFYVFTGELGAGFITRVVVATGEVLTAGVIPNGDYIVGAGVSTCAPED